MAVQSPTSTSSSRATESTARGLQTPQSSMNLDSISRASGGSLDHAKLTLAMLGSPERKGSSPLRTAGGAANRARPLVAPCNIVN